VEQTQGHHFTATRLGRLGPDLGLLRLRLLLWTGSAGLGTVPPAEQVGQNTQPDSDQNTDKVQGFQGMLRYKVHFLLLLATTGSLPSQYQFPTLKLKARWGAATITVDYIQKRIFEAYPVVF
jgi:hypothetical protein